MRLTFATVFLQLTLMIGAQAQAFGPLPQDMVRVRIKSLPKEFRISGMGLRVQSAASPFRPVAIPPRSTQAAVRVLHKDARSLWALRLNNQEREQLFTDRFLLIEGEGLRVGAESLPNRVFFMKKASGEVDAIGVLSLEDYIVGVLASEMPLSWPLETLKAQAIAARSYALAVMAERKNKVYHLESTVLDQVFRHIDEETQDPLLQKALRAVRETKGKRLTAANGRPLKAFYHADCGGQTITAREVWKSGINTGVVRDASCPTGPHAHWHVRMRRQELAAKLGMQDFESLVFIRSGTRIQSVQVNLSAAESRILSAQEFREKLGYENLKSTLFEVKQTGDLFEFEGKGFGHGVGLCQWGSRALGLKGQNYQQILAHYYPLASLK